jgi:hypothetical protein
MKRIIILIFIATALMATAHEAEFVLVRDGIIKPELAVATMSDISSNAVAAMVAAQSAVTVSNAVAEVQVLIDGVTDIVNSLEGIGYIRGYVLDFGVSEVHINTNITATIIKYEHDVDSDSTHVYSDLWTYYTEEPATLPVVRWATSPRENAVWTDLESVENELEWVTVGGAQYEAFRTRVKIPLEISSAFYRVIAEAQQQHVGSYLPVRTGIKVGGYEPLTEEFTVGTNVIKYVGGIRVQ